jgi:hypothetical protein
MEGTEENDEVVSKKAKYAQIIEWVFFKNFVGEKVRIPFTREELVVASDSLGFARMKNLGDIPYSFRFRRDLPHRIQRTAPAGKEWIILGAGIGLYEFRLALSGKVVPSVNRLRIKVPDATPEIVRHYAPGTDEQALLTRARYNRLIDIFTGLTCYSVQNHLRTTIDGIGQIEVDEIYVGINRRGAHFVIPCQAKSAKDRFGIVQLIQDIELCKNKYPNAICKPIAIQFIESNSIAMLELAVTETDEILALNVVEERHYDLIPRSDIDEAELQQLLRNEL